MKARGRSQRRRRLQLAAGDQVAPTEAALRTFWMLTAETVGIVCLPDNDTSPTHVRVRITDPEVERTVHLRLAKRGEPAPLNWHHSWWRPAPATSSPATARP